MFPTVAAVPLTAACWVAVWATCPALQPDEGGSRGQPAGRQGHGDGGTARFEAVHPEASCSAGEAPVTSVASDNNLFDYAQ